MHLVSDGARKKMKRIKRVKRAKYPAAVGVCVLDR
jgi:hypothetical protein